MELLEHESKCLAVFAPEVANGWSMERLAIIVLVCTLSSDVLFILSGSVKMSQSVAIDKSDKLFRGSSMNF